MERRCGGVVMMLMLMMLPLVASQHTFSEKLPPPCDSEIYCHGELLKTVQMAKLYNDSKHFVDMSLVNNPNETLHTFNTLMNETNHHPNIEQIRNFVKANFKEPGSEFEPWEPKDWQANPEFLKKVQDPELQKWGEELNKVWKSLGRHISSKVQEDPDKYSQIYVPNPVIVPGGRFREFYYWDSYWTIDGLLLCGMKDTVKGMLENFLQMVRDYDMVPNGGRVYYTRRSQPPFLIPMFKLYMDHVNDYTFLEANIHLLEKEFLFWENNRTVDVQDSQGVSHQVAQYKVEVGEPRPESYREDYELAEKLPDDKREQIYVELKSGAESGWDYSTRWFVNNQTNKGTLADLKVTSIVPVDLNSLLCLNAHTLSQFYNRLANHTQAKRYEELAKAKNETMTKIFWDDKDGIWYDYDLNARAQRRYFYLSNINPIWSGCYGHESKHSQAEIMEKVINYLEKQKVTKYVGGIPTSLEDSHQQWDFPNAWAPLQHSAIMGLHKARSIHHAADNLAFSLAEKWIRTNWKGYQQSTPHAMFEKYNVSVVGLAGGGGEYDVQVGFGWSNGVALRLLDVFSDRLTATTGASASFSPASILSLLILALLSLATSHLF